MTDNRDKTADIGDSRAPDIYLYEILITVIVILRTYTLNKIKKIVWPNLIPPLNINISISNICYTSKKQQKTVFENAQDFPRLEYICVDNSLYAFIWR